MPLDDQIFFALNALAGRSHGMDSVIIFGADYLRYILLAAFLVWAWRAPSERKERFFVPALAAAISRYVFAALIRLFYHHPRPFVVFRIRQLVPEHGWSFPSGHAAFFFALAASIWAYDRRWGTGFFVASAVMGCARIMAGVHYPSDVLAGAVLGVITAACVVALRDLLVEKKQPYKL